MAQESNEFNDDFIDEVVDELIQDSIDTATKIAITAHNLLSVRTPVDTGQAHAGWNFTLNRKEMTRPERPKKGQPQLPIQDSKPDKVAERLGDKYHLVNAVEHIIYLNEGHSDKAPENFVEIECKKAVDKVGEQ